jgi:hypothetical protein
MTLEKAKIKNIVTDKTFQVLFNPEEYTLNKDINYAQAAVPGLSGPILQFVNGNMTTLEMELLLDSYEDHQEGEVTVAPRSDVRLLTQQFSGLMDINSDTHAPPLLLFTWGTLTFQCVLARVSQRYIMFLPDGTPCRARLNVTFHEYIDPTADLKATNPQTADYTKEHIVGDRETLSAIAAALYGQPQLWRPIAIYNDIADPRSIRTGQRLKVPSLPFVDPQTGERFVKP